MILLRYSMIVAKNTEKIRNNKKNKKILQIKNFNSFAVYIFSLGFFTQISSFLIVFLLLDGIEIYHPIYSEFLCGNYFLSIFIEYPQKK